ncbi:DNA internalization-related competence protein ComEC/Rec2 [Limnohabitans sp.]|uniref:DNA internalization-related competence protein ComEC/Rec2 n=1 Tax=Limnohabitans sp. TaxID=1907725 RepID=UPI00286F9985|nr:DNA internalization-related competence protein ComEC/Rec2 [Limnohabitans sp.]
MPRSFSRITPWCLGWLLGTGLQLQQAALLPMAFYGGLAFAALCALAWLLLRRVQANEAYAVRSALGWALLALILAFAQTGWRAHFYLESRLSPALEGQSIEVDGVVASLPQRTEDSVRFRLEVLTADLPRFVWLGWYGASVWGADAGRQVTPPPEVKAGDRWRLTVRLKAPHGHINPHGFDHELWLWEQGLQATGYVRHGAKDAPPEWLGSTWRYPVAQLRQAVRARVSAQVPDHAMAGIVSALLLGDQAAIERADWDVFRATGVAHLMAISGLHITGLAWLAAAGMGWLWRRSDVWATRRPWSLWLPAPHAAQLCGVVVALLYAVFTGWGVPAQRTVWMLATVALLRWQGLRWPWPSVWLLVCAVVLALDPWALLQAGFWLSFVAVGILFASGSADVPTRLADRDADVRGLPMRLWRAVHRMGREQWLMSVCLAPLCLLLFHQVSVVGLLANVLAVPWVTLVVTPLCVLGMLFAPAWGWAGEALQVLRSLLGALASVPWAQWSAPAAPMWAGAAALLGMGLLALRVPLWMRLLGLALVMPVLSWQMPRPAHGTFELLAADMGQGHAVLLRTATHALLYDTGPRYSAETDAGQRVLVPLLRAWGERLDRVVISHQDSDHSGGAPAVLAMQPAADVLTSMPATHPMQQLRPMQRCERGQTWVWDGVQFEVLHPRAEDYTRQLKPNALSCVLRVSAPRVPVRSAAATHPSARDASPFVSALLAGDIEAAQEQSLVQSGQSLQADWLLVPHHGSATSSTATFLEAVRPQVAMVQAGYRNRFGHPRADVLARYAPLGAQVVQSPRCGASLWRSDQPNLVHCERENQHRYWFHQVP